jgi:hypothetical protein
MPIKKNKKCEGEEEFEQAKSLKGFPGTVEITPLKDFPQGIHQNQIHIDEIKEGVPVSIPQKFLQNMVTEGVIKEIPKT